MIGFPGGAGSAMANDLGNGGATTIEVRNLNGNPMKCTDLTLDIVDEGVAEGDEMFTLTIVSVTSNTNNVGTIGAMNAATVTISDAAAPPPAGGGGGCNCDGKCLFVCFYKFFIQDYWIYH